MDLFNSSFSLLQNCEHQEIKSCWNIIWIKIEFKLISMQLIYEQIVGLTFACAQDVREMVH